jgi:hypothetical protein
VHLLSSSKGGIGFCTQNFSPLSSTDEHGVDTGCFVDRSSQHCCLIAQPGTSVTVSVLRSLEGE